jgi:hypothetical protein
MPFPRLGTRALPLPCHDLTMVLPTTTTRASNFCVHSCGFATSTTKHHLPTHMGIYIHACAYMYTSTTYTHTRTHTCACMHLHTHTRMYTRVCACIIYTYMYMCVCMCLHLHTHQVYKFMFCLVVVPAKPQGWRRGGGGVNGQAFAIILRLWVLCHKSLIYL